MKPIRTAGCILLTLVAAALGFVATASAAGGAPVFYECGKAVPKNTGKYSDKECSKAVASGGKYERLSAVGATYTSKTKVSVFFTPHLVGLGEKVTCKSGTAAGRITGANFGEDRLTFKNCATEGKPCNSAGEPTGTIETSELATELVGTEDSPKIEYTSPTEYISNFDCEGLLFRVSGLALGTYTSPPAGHANKKSTDVFGDEFELRTEVSPDDEEEWLGEGGGFPAEESATWDNTASAPLGID